MDRIGIGVIGCGTVAGYGHLPATVSVPLVELKAVADINRERVRKVAEKYGVEAYTDYRGLLKRKDIEAVIVATPTFTHAQIVVDAAKQGKHVLCEKPIAMTLEEADKMIKTAEDYGIKLAIGFTRRSSNSFIKIKELLDKGIIGNLVYIKQVSDWCGPIWAGHERYKWMINKGGGPLIDSAVHDFDLLRWYSGSEAERVYAGGRYLKKNIVYPDHVNVIVTMKNGVIGYIEHSWGYWKASHTVFHVVGEKGVIIREDKVTKVVTEEGIETFETPSDEDRFKIQLESFARAIRGEGEVRATGLDGKLALEIALAALKSIKTGKVVKIKRF